MTVSIHEADLADIPVIQTLAEQTWWPTYSGIVEAEQIRFMLDTIYGTEPLTNVMRDGTQMFILLQDEGGFQGFASYGVRKEEPSVYKLHKLYVHPRNQGKGYGRMLVEEIKDRLKTQGVHTLDLNVNRHNNAKSFYEKLGFIVVREEDVPIGPYWMNDFVMRLEF